MTELLLTRGLANERQLLYKVTLVMSNMVRLGNLLTRLLDLAEFLN